MNILSSFSYLNLNPNPNPDNYKKNKKNSSRNLQSDIGKRENAFEELNLRVQLLENHKRLVQTFFVDWSIGQFKEIPTSCVFYANF